MLYSVSCQRTRRSVLRLLEELDSSSSILASLYIPPSSAGRNIEKLNGVSGDFKELQEDISRLISGSKTGAVIFWGEANHYLIIPPFPIMEEKFLDTCHVQPLYRLLQEDHILALILVRLGLFSLGIFEGENLLTSKTGKGLIHGRHRQGGSSAHRFERHREKQMETFFTRLCAYTREQLEPYERLLDYVIYGGTRQTVLEFRKQCLFLSKFDVCTLDRLIDVREPNQAGLMEGIKKALSSKVVQWIENK